MQGVHSYDVLANTLYTDAFQYYSAVVPNRNDMIRDDDSDDDNNEAQSDLVKIFLNLAFLPEKKALHFSFDKNAYKDQLRNL